MTGAVMPSSVLIIAVVVEDSEGNEIGRSKDEVICKLPFDLPFEADAYAWHFFVFFVLNFDLILLARWWAVPIGTILLPHLAVSLGHRLDQSSSTFKLTSPPESPTSSHSAVFRLVFPVLSEGPFLRMRYVSPNEACKLLIGEQELTYPQSGQDAVTNWPNYPYLWTIPPPGVRRCTF
jgi:hypothetical protein